MTKEEVDFIGGMNMCDEISNEAYKKIMCHCEEQNPCEDAVSKASVFEIVGNLMSIPYDLDRRITEKDVSETMDEIMALPPVTPTQRWIPVSERLPENETCVLTTIKIPNRIARVRSGWYDSGFIHNDNGDVWKTTDMEVLAWMPLPKPYKTETESEV